MSGADEVGKKAIDAAKGLVEGAGNVAGDAAGAVGDVAGKGVDAAKGALGAVGGMLGGIGGKIGEVAGDAVDAAKGAVDKVGDAVGDVAGGAVDMAKGAADKVGELAGDAVDGVKGAVGGVAGAVGDVAGGAADLAKGAVDGVGNLVGGAADKVGGAGAAALGAGAAAIGGVAAMAGGLGKGVTDTVGNAANSVGDTGAAAFSGLTAKDQEGGDKGPGFLAPLFGVLALGALAYVGWYTFTKGKPAEPAAVTAPAAPEVPAWIKGIGDTLKGQFAWLGLGASGQNVIVSGEAPDGATAQAAFAAAQAAVKAAPEGANSLVIDNIKVAGDTSTPIGAALAALGANPDVAACNKAFADTMAGRTINFVTGGSAIGGDNARLLDTLTGVASACKAHKIEIGGHTDSKGKPESNQALSQRRADAVKAYWTGKGVAAEGLVATGFGETKPIDPVGDEVASEKNRRIEFTVTDAAAAPAAAAPTNAVEPEKK